MTFEEYVKHCTQHLIYMIPLFIIISFVNVVLHKDEMPPAKFTPTVTKTAFNNMKEYDQWGTIVENCMDYSDLHFVSETVAICHPD